MNYQQLAKDIIERIGGLNNVKDVTHCATRLRFTLNTMDPVDKGTVSALPGVLGAVESSGQFQVILGQQVGHVFSAITLLKNNKSNATPAEVRQDPADVQKMKKENVVSQALGIISGIFTPILPAISGAAMLKTLLIILTMTGLMEKTSQTWVVLNFAADTTFYFLPIMLAYTSAMKFGMNPFVAMTLGGMLLHPTFTAMVATRSPLSFLNVPVSLVHYGSTVIPVILMVWIASWAESLSERLSPRAILFFMKPFLTLLIMVPLGLTIIAPFGDFVGKGIGVGITYVNDHCIWLLPFIMAVFSPIFIMTGMHYAVTMPITFQSLATNGFDMIGAGFLVSNIAQGAAALAAARFSKDADFRALASGAGFTALLGITEPALYGVNLKLKKPFYAVLVAGAVGGLFVGIMGVKRMTLAPTGLTTLPVFIDPNNSMNIVFAISGAAISFCVAYFLTVVLLRIESGNKTGDVK